jgi:hypothetical protein
MDLLGKGSVVDDDQFTSDRFQNEVDWVFVVLESDDVREEQQKEQTRASSTVTE